MPAKTLTPAFIDTLTWNKALRTVEDEHQQRHQERHEKSHAKLNEERLKKGEPELPLPPTPPAPALKPPVQIAYLDKMERGLSLMLVLGAGGTTGSIRAMRANPDGYTIEMGQLGTHAASVAFYPNLAYRPEADFAYIGLAVDQAVLIVARRDFPPNN